MANIMHNGKELPAVLTVGTFRTYQEETGRDFLTEESRSVYSLADLAWCGVRTAHEARGQEYKVGRKQFVAQMRMDELKALGEWFQKEQGEEADEPSLRPDHDGETGEKKEA